MLRRTKPRTALRFTPTAWAKFLCLRDLGQTEVGAFGLSPPDDLLQVEDVVLVRQVCSVMTVAFEDEAVADYFDAQIDQGRKPDQFARIWLHTHPGHSAEPSSTDEETFSRVFGGCDWAVMGILARGGATYARLRFHVGPGGELQIPIEIDYRHPFAASDAAAWEAEYAAAVREIPVRLPEREVDFWNDPFSEWLPRERARLRTRSRRSRLSLLSDPIDGDMDAERPVCEAGRPGAAVAAE